MLPEISLPTAEHEKANPAEADATYASYGDYLLSKTRDKERFQLLFQENANYGFRRNLWAMKPVGIAISILSLAALAFATQVEARAGAVPWFANLTAIAIVALLLTWQLVRITPSWVKIVADAYAVRLLASIDELQSKRIGSTAPFVESVLWLKLSDLRQQFRLDWTTLDMGFERDRQS